MRRRVSDSVTSSIRLDHDDVLVMDGLAQSEYEHCTASELQGPRVNLTYRWVAQHTTSCPLAGVVGCLLPTCVQGSVEPSSGWLGEGENKWSSSWGLVLLLLILVSVLLASTWIHIWRGHRHSGQRPSCSVVHFSSRGRAGLGDGVGHCPDVAKLPRVCLFISLIYFLGTCCTLFSRVLLRVFQYRWVC